MLPGFEALIVFSGSAPDQYRVAPYILIDAIRDALNLVTLRVPIVIFESLFVFLSVFSIRKHFDVGQKMLWCLLLIYPFLMVGGYRPITSFILFLSIQLVVSMRNADSGQRNAWLVFAILIAVMSFTRADVAFLIAVAAFGLQGASYWSKGCIAAIPLVAQFLLSTVIFPEAEYYSQLIMIADNLSLIFLLVSPLTYLFIGLLLFYWDAVLAFFKFSAQNNRIILAAMVGYVAVLLVIARPNEYRLLLPFLPLVLWLLQEQKTTGVASV